MDLSWLTASPWPIIILAFAGTAALIALAFLYERRAQRRAERILNEGEPAEATVLGARDTGWRTNGRAHIAFRLEVRRPGHPPYAAEARLMIPRWTPIPYPTGSVVAVRVDRERPEQVVFAGGKPVLGGLMAGDPPLAGVPGLGGGLLNFGSSNIRSVSVGRVSAGDMVVLNGQAYASVDDMPPDARAAYEQAMGALADKDGDGVPDIFGAAAPGAGSAERLRQLKAMYDEGLITAAEYEAKKAKILERL